MLTCSVVIAVGGGVLALPAGAFPPGVEPLVTISSNISLREGKFNPCPGATHFMEDCSAYSGKETLLRYCRDWTFLAWSIIPLTVAFAQSIFLFDISVHPPFMFDETTSTEDTVSEPMTFLPSPITFLKPVTIGLKLEDAKQQNAKIVGAR